MGSSPTGGAKLRFLFIKLGVYIKRMHTIYYSKSIPFITKENLVKLNQYLSEVEINIDDNLVIAVNSASEYFNKFKIDLTLNDNGDVIKLYCRERTNLKDILYTIIDYITPNVHFYDFDKESIRYTIRKSNIVRVY